MHSISSAVENFLSREKISADFSFVNIRKRFLNHGGAESCRGTARAEVKPLGPLVRTSHFYFPESRRRSSVACAHYLLRLSLAAIWSPPQGPLIAGTDRIHRVPEPGCESAVGRILQHAHALAIFDFPANLGAELEVVTLVVNGPRPVGLKQNCVIGGSNELLECQRLLAGQNTDISHPDDGQTVPSFGA